MKCHSYITIENQTSGKLVIKKSSFLSFAIPVETVEEAEDIVKDFKKKYYDARHVCFSYVLSPDGSVFRAADNGEPSGTAGRPIIGVIRSAELTNIMIVVIRYFGGIKLGVPGLIAAYKEAAELALSKAVRVTKIVEDKLTLHFSYEQLDGVMKTIKKFNLPIINCQIDMSSCITIKSAQDVTDVVKDCLSKIPTVRFDE